MIDRNNTKSNGVFDRDMMRENIRECCEEILVRSPRVLEFILSKAHKNEVPSQEEFENFHELQQSSILVSNIIELWSTLNGRPYYLPDFLQNDYIFSTLTSIARPIFIEEAEMMLHAQACTTSNNSSNLQHNQQQAPSLEQSQYTVAGDEIHDSDNDLSDL